MVYNAFSALTRGFLPPYCLLCLSGESVGDDYLCSGCKAELPWLRHCCEICSLPLTAATASRCGRCQQQHPTFDCCVGAFFYADPIARLISDYKYRAKLNYGRVLGLQLATRLAHHYQQQVLPAVVVPVPLHRSRLRSRGFNQSLELAKTVAGQLGMPVAHHHLVRCKATSSQKDLQLNDRQRNVRDAFAIREKHPLPATVALIDDVVTSGATVAELARLLKQNGVQKVHVWCVARTERG
ncbi:MAG: ComF family protein [Pseudomonadales bacterium]